ncbi:DUF11 domain-containing protein [Opitutaceae bacterium TAV4]|nr:DUF11 domain-containing protein [Opitutaceae bacterium TAV4]RRK00413.1 DUF11 domain-containing protein [Opitutaceae bacterium TAV3]
MNTTTSHPPSRGRRGNWLRTVLAGLTIAGLALIAYAAAPLANTPIGNQAKATYTDASAVVREVFSNTVITTVTQVAGFTLVTDLQQKVATPGSQVYFPHTLTNTGNGIDTFTLTPAQNTSTDDFNLTSFFIYPDSNQDGLPDNYTPITTTGPLAPGAEFHVVLVGIVPPTATAGNTGIVSITAATTLAGSTLGAITNTDTVTVVSGAVLNVTKAINTPSGLPAATGIKYTITYTNTGNATATKVTLKDVIPAGLTYVAGSARWSVLGATALSDTDEGTTYQGTDPNQIAYRYENGAGTNTLEAVIQKVAPGQSGFITFDVTVNARTYFTTNIPPIVLPAPAPNTATYDFTENGSAPSGTPYNTNTVPFTILQDVSSTLTGDTTPQDNTKPGTPGDTASEIPSTGAPAGSTVVWHNVVENTGSGIDTFDITVGNSNFPSGTTFQLYQNDGQTPLGDSNGNSTPDTGPLAPGGKYTVVLKAILPTNASGNNGGSGFKVTKTATSTVDPTETSNGDDTLAAIVGASVDLTNNKTIAGGADTEDGKGIGPESSAIVTNATNPGSSTTFTLYVNNTGPFADSFNLSSGGGTPSSIGALPAGWTVVFHEGSATGPVVSNTGSIPAGGSKVIYAVVSVPAGYKAGDESIFFKVASPINAAAVDTIHDQVTVNVIRGLSLQTDQVGQTYPGGSVVYEHILKNNSNVTEGNTTGSTIGFDALHDSLSAIGFTSVLYYDANGDGILDSADPVVTTALNGISGLSGGLASGQQIRLFVKVFAPLGAPDNASNATTLTVTVTTNATGPLNGITIVAPISNFDTTSVTRGDLSVEKKQALDANTDGEPDLPFTTAQLTAPPGTRILYQVTVTNTGSADATSITVNDTAPANTTFDTTYGSAPYGTVTYTDNTGASPAPGTFTQADGVITVDIGTLKPAAKATITFAVKINQ